MRLAFDDGVSAMDMKSKATGPTATQHRAVLGQMVQRRSVDPSDVDYRPGFMELLPQQFEPEKGAAHKFRVAITLLPKFTLMAFAGFVDALRLSSDIGDRSHPNLCSWTLVGADKNEVTSSCGAAIAHKEIFSDPSRFDFLVVVGGLLGEAGSEDPRMLAYIRCAVEAGVTIVGLCTGVFALAQAGVLQGHRVCVHGYHLSDFTERFPSLRPVSNQIFVVDRKRITCAGGAASVDVAGYIIKQQCGSDRARKILPHMLLDELRPSSHPQLSFADDFFKVHDQRVRRAIFLMQQNLGGPLSIDRIAQRIGVPPRQLERGFQRSFSVSPSAFYRTMRLERTKWLLAHSNLTITQIAVDCGFADTSHLTRTFKRQFGALPTDFRRQATLVEPAKPAA
jgi:transcriptional regulator GlxA family with amidase domain